MKKLLLSFFLFILVSTGFAQETKEEIQKKQQQLQKELADLNKTLNTIKANKKISLGQLSLVQKKIDTRQALISSINRDVRRLNNEIYLNSIEIYRLKKELDTLSRNYAKSLVFAYKNRSNYDYLNFIFSANNFNDALKRIAYLRSYRQYRETQVNAIKQTQEILELRTTQLTSSKTQKDVAIKEQSTQISGLQKDRNEKDQVVKQLKSEEKSIGAKIKTNEKTRVKLQQALQAIIKREIAAAKKAEEQRLANLRAEEAKRKAAEAAAAKSENTLAKAPAAVPAKEETVVTTTTAAPKRNRTYSALESTDESLSQSINFETNRGSLPWSVSTGFVSTHFGHYNVPGTSLTGDMPGIEISMPAGTTVKAVADGVVSAVFDMGDGQAVVVRHGKYFTTYSHLGSVNVSRDQNINAGTVLGKAAVSFEGDGQIIFMVTNEKNVNLNPESWLKSK